MYAGADMAFRLGNTLHGIGAVFQNDEFGLFSHQRFSVQYAYRFKLFGGQLAVGVEADMLNEKWTARKPSSATPTTPPFPVRK